MTLAFHREFAR